VNSYTEAVVTVLTLIVGVAILSVIVSTKSNTVGVLQAFGSAFSNALGVATAPVTGAAVSPNLSYPTSPMGTFGGMNFPTFR